MCFFLSPSLSLTELSSKCSYSDVTPVSIKWIFNHPSKQLWKCLRIDICVLLAWQLWLINEFAEPLLLRQMETMGTRYHWHPLSYISLLEISPLVSLMFLPIISHNLCEGRGGDERLDSYELQLGEGRCSLMKWQCQECDWAVCNLMHICLLC